MRVARRAGKYAAKQRDSRERRADDRIRRRVERRKAVQHVREIAREAERAEHAGRDADRDDRNAAPQHELEHVARCAPSAMRMPSSFVRWLTT